MEFPGVLMKKSCGIFYGFGFWQWNFQRVSHNFAEFPGVRTSFPWNFFKVKVANLKIPVGFFRNGIAHWYHEKCTQSTFSIMPKAITQTGTDD